MKTLLFKRVSKALILMRLLRTLISKSTVSGVEEIEENDQNVNEDQKFFD